MNLHEYQGKELIKRYGVKIQEGIPVDTPEQAVEAARQLQTQTGTNIWVVKAQIHAGGLFLHGLDVGLGLCEFRHDSKYICGFNMPEFLSKYTHRSDK